MGARTVAVLVWILSLAMAAPVLAAESKTAKGSIRSVDHQGRTLTIRTKDGAGKGGLELEVSRKAKITVDGAEASLADLRVGQEAVVTYESALLVATEVKATGAGEPAPEIVNVAEINTKNKETSPWPSPDGLTLYWIAEPPGAVEGEVWTASRKNAGSFFAEKRLVGHGRHVTVSADGLTMFLIARRADGKPGDSIMVARRASTAAAFGRPQGVPELASIDSPRNLYLTEDGRTLLFNDGSSKNGTFRVVEANRTTPQGRWGAPRPLKLQQGVEGLLTCPCLTPDGLTLLGVLAQDGANPRPTFFAWSRKSPDKPFGNPLRLSLPGVEEFAGWLPRYVEKTGELYFSSQRISPDGNMDIWLVRNSKPLLQGVDPGDRAGGRGTVPGPPVRLRVSISKEGEGRIHLGRVLPAEALRPADGLVPITGGYAINVVGKGAVVGDGGSSLRFGPTDPKLLRSPTGVCFPRALRLPCVASMDIGHLRPGSTLALLFITPTMTTSITVESDDELRRTAIVRVECTTHSDRESTMRFSMKAPVEFARAGELQFRLPPLDGEWQKVLSLSISLNSYRHGTAGIKWAEDIGDAGASVGKVSVKGSSGRTLGMRWGAVRGVLVVNDVLPDSLASRAGIAVGDEIVGIDDGPCPNEAHVLATKVAFSRKLSFRVRRGRDERTVAIVED
ncbi:MAG: hypothetical protein JWN86_1336 [Planctomycetota bacterium]|nr:hypothetical protein [Planctomycetota bacterium]